MKKYRFINCIAYLLVCLGRFKPEIKIRVNGQLVPIIFKYEARVSYIQNTGIYGVSGTGRTEKEAINSFYENLQAYYYNKISENINSIIAYLGSTGFTNWLLLITILLLLIK